MDFRSKYTQTESEGVENDIPRTKKWKERWVVTLISDKIDFKANDVKRDKEGHDRMIKGLIQEDDIVIVIIYASTTGAPTYKK